MAKKIIKSTGNAQEDAKLIAEALKNGNSETFEEAKVRHDKSMSGQHSGNTLVAEPHAEGDTLLVLDVPDEPKAAQPVFASAFTARPELAKPEVK